MYIVIKNENERIINSLSINTVKTLVGKYTVADLERELSFLDYDKAIVDITSIINYYDDNYLFGFLSFFKSPSSIILLLDDNFVSNSKIFLSKLINRGYYNIATTDGAVINLLNTNNSFDDVKYLLDGYDFMKSDTIVSSHEMDNSYLDDKIIIGIDNGTLHAGATTFMYMLVKELSKSYNVKGIEMCKTDSSFFKDDRVICCNSKEELEIIIKSLKDVQVYIIDLNGSDARVLCNSVIYLVETGIIKLTKLLKGNRDIFNALLDKNIVLNRSHVVNSDISNFEYESKLRIFDIVPNLNERDNDFPDMRRVFDKLNIKKKKKSFFNIFK